MLRELLLGIGIGGIIFTKNGKKIVNEQINSLKDYMLKSVSDTDIIKMGKEFLNGYNGTEQHSKDSKAIDVSEEEGNTKINQKDEDNNQEQQENFKRITNSVKKY